ncbi:MAG: hypothetical protein IKR18_07285, partial [Bacteroidaceae bacterium]|nr:hypothetical protein [Bacteroidaceae bacterium]
MKKTLLVSFFFLLLLPIFGGHYSSLSAQGLPDQEIDEVVVEAEYKIECPHCGAKLNDIEYATHECKPDLSDSEPEYRCSICNRPYSE